MSFYTDYPKLLSHDLYIIFQLVSVAENNFDFIGFRVIYCQWIIDVLYYSSSLLMIIGIIEKQTLKMKVSPWQKVNELWYFVGWRGDNHPQTGSWLKSKVCLGAEEKDGHHTIPGAEARLLGGNKVHSAVWDVSSTHVKGLYYCMLLSLYTAGFFFQGLESLDHVLFLDHLRPMHLIVTCAVIEILSWMEIIDKCRLLVKLKSFHCV